MRLFKRTRELTGRFSERCGRLCNDACRRVALHERALLQQLWLGVRI